MSSQTQADVISEPASSPLSGSVSAQLAALIVELQSVGLRVEAQIETRDGGAGPTDSGMLWIEGVPTTVPTRTKQALASPYSLKWEDAGYGIYRDGRRLADVTGTPRPKFYDLTTSDGVPYWKIGLMHLDSFASTVVQTCSYWATPDQCAFCGIGISLDAGRTIVKKTPAQLAEVALAARDLDGAVDATLTTGSSNGVDRGARYVAKCGNAIKESAGLPVEVQFEPPRDLDVLNEVHDLGIDSVGIHVVSFDPEVLARVAPGKART
jgi:radical SAM protein (TIGR04043 family)